MRRGLVVTTRTLETALWLGALAAVANRHAAHLERELGERADAMVRGWRLRARA